MEWIDSERGYEHIDSERGYEHKDYSMQLPYAVLRTLRLAMEFDEDSAFDEAVLLEFEGNDLGRVIRLLCDRQSQSDCGTGIELKDSPPSAAIDSRLVREPGRSCWCGWVLLGKCSDDCSGGDVRAGEDWVGCEQVCDGFEDVFVDGSGAMGAVIDVIGCRGRA